MNTKTVSLGTLLSVTTCRAIVNFNETHKLISFCVGEDLFSHQLGSEAGYTNKASKLLCEQFPFLSEIGNEMVKWLDEFFLELPLNERTYEKIQEKLAEYEKRFGVEFVVKR